MGLITTFYFWSTVLVIAAFALFVEAVALIRFFLRQRRPLWLYLFILLPLSVSVWSFIVVFQSPPPLPDFIGDVHFTIALYHALMAPYVSATMYDQRLLITCAVVFVLMLVIERIFHVRNGASSQYTSNARSTSLLSRDTENTLQMMVFQSRKVH